MAALSFEGFRSQPDKAIFRRVAFSIIALLIFLPPTLPIVFGINVHWIKGWQMYHYAGLGLLKGEFTIHRGKEVIERLSPLQVIGLKRYPFVKGITANFTRLVYEKGDLKAYAADLCARISNDERLAYTGFASTLDGWISVGNEDVCGEAP